MIIRAAICILLASLSGIGLFLSPQASKAQSIHPTVLGFWCQDHPQGEILGVRFPSKYGFHILLEKDELSFRNTVDAFKSPSIVNETIDAQSHINPDDPSVFIRQIDTRVHHSSGTTTTSRLFSEMRLANADLLEIDTFATTTSARDGQQSSAIAGPNTNNYEISGTADRCSSADYERLYEDWLRFNWLVNQRHSIQEAEIAALESSIEALRREEYQYQLAREQAERERSRRERVQRQRQLGSALGVLLSRSNSFIPNSGQSTLPNPQSFENGGGSCERQLRAVMAREQNSAVGLCQSGRALVNVGRAARSIAPSCGAAQASVLEQAQSFERQGRDMMCRTCANLSC